MYDFLPMSRRPWLSPRRPAFAQTPRHRRCCVGRGSGGGVRLEGRFWADVEAEQEELARLEEERNEATRRASRFSKRSGRLVQSVSSLYQEALHQMKDGNENEARRLLTAKSSIVKAVHVAQEKTSANSALASKLDALIGKKQLALLEKIMAAGKSLD